MDDDHRELVRRLFAAATALIETAHDAAIAGQSETLTAKARGTAGFLAEVSDTSGNRGLGGGAGSLERTRLCHFAC